MRRIAVAAVVLMALPAAAMAQGMPQLDFKNPLTISQAVWLAIIFAVLYVLLSRWGLPQVAEVLEFRAATIARDLEAAQKAKAESDAAIAEMTAATRNAHAEAQAEINAALERAKAEAAAQAAELNAQLEEQLAVSERRIAAARAAAMGALRQVATETGEVLLTRLTGHAPARASLEQAVGDVLVARGRA